jgi:hypothetical protein
MDATVEVVGAGGVEWPNSHTLTGRIECQVTHCWRAWFDSWLGDAIDPGAIVNDMRDCNIIDEVKAITLGDGDGRLEEGCVAHVDIGTAIATATAGTTTRCDHDGEQAQRYEDCYEMFHGLCFSFYLQVGCVDLFSMGACEEAPGVRKRITYLTALSTW